MAQNTYLIKLLKLIITLFIHLKCDVPLIPRALLKKALPTERDKCEVCLCWIQSTKKDPPEWMRCRPDTSAYGIHLEYAWIGSVKTEPPEWMRRRGGSPSLFGATSAMLWLATNKTNPPRWMWHDPAIRSNNTQYIGVMWIEHMKTEPPEWMRGEDKWCIQSMASAWIKHMKTEPPEWMRSDDKQRIKWMALGWIKHVKTEPPEWMRCDDIWCIQSMASAWIEHMKTEPPEWMRCEDKRFLRTIALDWIKHVKTEPPEWMQGKSSILGVEGMTLAMTWIMYVKTEPPEWMRHKSSIQNREGMTAAMIWFRYAHISNGYNMPSWMRHSPQIRDENMKTAHLHAIESMCLTEYVDNSSIRWVYDKKMLKDRHGRNCLLYCIKYNKRLTEGLPEELYTACDAKGMTPAMHWIIQTNTAPPKKLVHDPTIVTKDAMMTAAMVWIDYIKSEPPTWMQHNPELRDANGRTVGIHWIRVTGEEPRPWMRYDGESRVDLCIEWITRNRSEPPESLRCDAEDRNESGNTAAMAWLTYCRSELPKWMLHDPSIRNNKGENMSMIYLSKHMQRRFDTDADGPIAIYNSKYKAPSIKPPKWMLLTDTQSMVDLAKTYITSARYAKRIAKIPKYIRRSLEGKMTYEEKLDLAKHYIQTRKSEPPSWLFDGASEEMLHALSKHWIEHCYTDIPESIRCNPSLLVDGYTIAMVWIDLLRCVPPEWMEHDPNIRNRDGLLIRDLWRPVMFDRLDRILSELADGSIGPDDYRFKSLLTLPSWIL